MDVTKYLAVMVMFCFQSGESGGHGEHHHDHVRIHLPEFIHKHTHKKVITIHHHHHKPKEKHHHHHHHHKPHHIPNIGHHHKHHKISIHTVSKGHGHHHKHHGHHHKHHGHHHKHHGHHGHHGHGHHHHDTPSYDVPIYDPGLTYEADYGTSAYPGISQPRLHGVTHTVKQVKVYDSHPGAMHPGIPSTLGAGNGYEVTEEGEEDDDAFTSINSIPQSSYPGTFDFVRNLAPQPSHNPFTDITPQKSVQGSIHDPFSTVPLPTTFSSPEAIMGNIQTDAYSAAPTQGAVSGVQISSEVPTTFQTGVNTPVSSFVGDTVSPTFAADDENGISEEYPASSYSREAGIQQLIRTGGHESLVY